MNRHSMNSRQNFRSYNMAFLILSSNAAIPPAGSANDYSSFFYSAPAFALYGLVTGLVIGILFSRRRHAAKRRRRREHQYTGASLVTAAEPLVRGSWSDREYLDLLQKFDALKSRNEDLQRENAELSKWNASAVTPPEPPVPVPATPEAILYFLQPTEGKFKESGRVARASDALYELTPDRAGGTEGTFRFVSVPDNVSMAVQNESNWILVACDRNNLPTTRTQRIQTETPGSVVKRGADWEILKKARISYV